MCGTDYCAACTNEVVIAWATGKIHEIPEFGDADQERVACGQRHLAFADGYHDYNTTLFLWPEYRSRFQLPGHVKRLTIALQDYPSGGLPVSLRPLTAARRDIIRNWALRLENRKDGQNALVLAGEWRRHGKWMDAWYIRGEDLANELTSIGFGNLPAALKTATMSLQEQIWQWVEKNLAEVELLLGGKTVYANLPTDREELIDRLAA